MTQLFLLPLANHLPALLFAAGLSAEPYVSGVVRIGDDQGCILLIASDGLWDVADADSVVQCVLQADR